jgi:hypothetical protein
MGTVVVTTTAMHSIPPSVGWLVLPIGQSQHCAPPLQPMYFPISHILHLVLLSSSFWKPAGQNCDDKNKIKKHAFSKTTNTFKQQFNNHVDRFEL